MRDFALSLVSLVLFAGLLQGAEPPAQVSYSRDIVPILQANCQGCHQPAKPGGSYVLTSYEATSRPGESGSPAVVPGKPDESLLLEQITPHDGTAEMPKGTAPLKDAEIALIRRWIEQGAIDDSPRRDGPKVDQNHPPVYQRAPLITSIDFSPDGQLLAIAGFHEVLLRSPESGELKGRLVGLSERIESVSFSPDGQRLAVAGGQPGRQGELQVWNIPQQELELSLPVTFDTIYGACWSPDGKLISVGCADSAVRAFDSHTGQQVFYNGAHDDWVLETVFSVDGSLLVSVGRDMSTKLYNVPTQRFIDNVTSITPGALKGGLTALTRAPGKDEILVGGSDGVPRIYRMERVTTRVIGDDANLLRQFPAMKGRIYGVAYAPDGKTMACASSLDGQGQVCIFTSEFDSTLPDDIKKILETRDSGQTPETRKRLEEFVTGDVKLLSTAEIPSATYALAYHPDGKQIAVAGADGMIRVLNAADGQIVREMPAVELAESSQLAEQRTITKLPDNQQPLTGVESLPAESQVVALHVEPTSIELNAPFESVQLLATGVLANGDRIDVTRLVKVESAADCLQLSPLGRVYPVHDGQGTVTVSLGERLAQIPVQIRGVDHPASLDFVRDVNPVLTRLGCNQGTCHGAKDGKNGFKLSLRGYDPIADVRAFTDDLKSRRTNVASPDDSLMLLKASGVVPHVGGKLTQPGEAYYEVLRRWIAEGTLLAVPEERVVSITIEPRNPVVQQLGARQQLRVVANFSSGRTRDVTGEAFLESGNTEVAEVNRAAVMTAVRRGEAPVLARYEGSYAATTLTVMGDRTGFVWATPETWGEVDQLIAAKWERMKIAPSELCSDDDFLRRVYLDLTGLPPSSAEVLAFRADSRPAKVKRDAVIDRLVGSEAYVEFWSNKWADLLQVNSKFLGKEGASQFRTWIRENVAKNTPYDDFCREILTASGSNKERPAASYYKILREPDALMENTTQLFLAIRFNCNKCHDHPFERWTQDQYYQTAAFFAQVGLKKDPQNDQGTVGGTAVEGAKPLWEVVFDKTDGEIKHDRTGLETPPLVPFDRDLPMGEGISRREQLAAWLASADNDYFASSYVNRVWGYLMGVGLIEPLDDIRAGNPPSNPELLAWLTDSFVDSGFDVQQLMKTICKSRVYQLEIETNKWNADDRINFSHALPKRLPAEVLYDAVHTVTGAKMNIPGVPAGTRAAALPDVAIGLDDGFLDNLGRPPRESSCECERSSELQLGPVMALMNGATVNQAISQPGNALEQLVHEHPDNGEMINQIFLRILNRPAREREIVATVEMMQHLQQQHAQLVASLKEYEQQHADEFAHKDAEWKAALAQAEADFERYDAETRPAREAAEQKRAELIAAAQQKVDEQKAKLVERLPEWEASLSSQQTVWIPLEFKKLTSSSKSTLTQQPDQSILATGPNNARANYVLEAKGIPSGITAIKLEALTDPSLPNGGPGRAPNGNFVVSELAAFVTKPKAKRAPLKLQNAKATFSQNSYDVSTAIDGQSVPDSNGWAISPQTGRNQSATFEFAEPLELSTDSTLTIQLTQMFSQNNHTLGRFRISVTSAAAPVNFGLPQNIQEILQIAADQRSEEQRQQLVEHLASEDPQMQELNKAVAIASEPVPVDEKLVALKDLVEKRKQPRPEDPQLARLQRAVTLSESQLQNSRLTAVQDLAWALINSPAFLFNR